MSDDEGAPSPPDDDPYLYPRLIGRTVLLVVSLVLLFPALLERIANGAWPRFVLGLGAYKWAAWGACFIGMALLRFAGGPKRE